MEYENLWDIPSNEEPIDTTSNLTEILRQQSQHLKEKTNGKVLGKFSRIKDLTAGIEAISSAIARGTVENEETKQLEDANSLYRNQRYGYEIYNSTYKFRVFEIMLSPVYPVVVSVDEGVLEDTRQELQIASIQKGENANQFFINSDNEFISFLKTILSSKKVRYILYRLQAEK